MSVPSTTVTRACSSCHVALLRSFLAVTSPELGAHSRSLAARLAPPTRRYTTSLRTSRNALASKSCARVSTSSTSVRSFSASAVWRAGHGYQLRESHDDNFTALDEEPIQGKSADDANFVPWYLQQSADGAGEAMPTAAGQEMPDMPEHAPELLEPIVEHTLKTLGLTHFTILDLRQMTDPPPALGANLIMVVATARSERHLHASADKLCRWLRTEYLLSPFADGLLGRNEMKIAVRRRVKRAKMMSAVGARSEDSGDIADGLRSDWICVNVGRVKGGSLPDLADAELKREIVGFGTTTDSSTIVVQMMTEEKRTEIDLEDLWGRALKRQIKQREAVIRSAEAAQGEEAQNPVIKPTQTSDGATQQNPTIYAPIHA